MHVVEHTGLTVGFERQRYSFAEPDAGTSLIRENICVTVSQGVLGFPLVVVPQWTPDTATGKDNHSSYSDGKESNTWIRV